jgi:hypothetical protein
MKQNITVALDKGLLKKARAIAAQRGSSVSAMLADELAKITDRESAYEQSRQRALARLRCSVPTPRHETRLSRLAA